jgi:hypothetical protein
VAIQSKLPQLGRNYRGFQVKTFGYNALHTYAGAVFERNGYLPPSTRLPSIHGSGSRIHRDTNGFLRPRFRFAPPSPVLRRDTFDHPDYIFELKMDGFLRLPLGDIQEQ